MIILNLNVDSVARAKEYYQWLNSSKLELKSQGKSDYWVRESLLAKILFFKDHIQIGGESGFYVPPLNGSIKPVLLDAIWRLYKRMVLDIDRRLGLSGSHSLSSCVTQYLAYDMIVKADQRIDYDENPFRFDHRKLEFLFKSSAALRQQWFLKDRYFADGHIITSAYYYSLFSHWLPSDAHLYLEIGAGNGNLASFFRHYGHMKISIIDLPETILYSFCYLNSIFPELRCLLPNEIQVPLTAESIREHDVIFLLPSQGELLPDSVFDLAVNVHSMQEMNQNHIDEYIKLVQKKLKDGGIWCNSNRVEKVPSRTGSPIRAFCFPYVSKNEVLVDEVDRYMRLIQLDGVCVRVERKNAN